MTTYLKNRIPEKVSTAKFVNNQPTFCFIAPTSLVEYHFPTFSQQRAHLLLAHLVDQSDKYLGIYKKIKNINPDTLFIMDNGAFELKTPYKPEKLVTLGKSIDADVIVLPDYPFQPGEKTIEAAEKYIEIFKNEGFKVMFVPQSREGDYEDWKNCYTWAANNDDIDIIGMSILGIPNALGYDLNVTPFARVIVTYDLIKEGKFAWNKHHHYLGLNSGPYVELPGLLSVKALGTVDSSGPAWSVCSYEYKGIQYNKFNEKSLDNPAFSINKPRKEVNFYFDYDKLYDKMSVIHNIYTINEFISQYKY